MAPARGATTSQADGQTGNVVAPLAGAIPPGSMPRDAIPNAIPPPIASDTDHQRFITLPRDLAHQVRDVLHLQQGEHLALLDNSGDEMLVAVAQVGKAGVTVQLIERRAGKSASPVRIMLCQGLLKSSRFEWILEKGTELGVSVFWPILTRRSMAGLEDAGAAKIQRWRRILQEAAEQCGRSRLPELLPVRPLMHALADIPPGALVLMPWEEEHTTSLRDALLSFRTRSHPNPHLHLRRGEGGADVGGWPLWSPAGGDDAPNQPITVMLFIGPEGGLTSDEVALARRHGAQVVSLGQRILRAETAALTAVANVMYELGE
jgi:16S rRNA (uracil1498-N3)-methyltransferase